MNRRPLYHLPLPALSRAPSSLLLVRYLPYRLRSRLQRYIPTHAFAGTTTIHAVDDAPHRHFALPFAAPSAYTHVGRRTRLYSYAIYLIYHGLLTPRLPDKTCIWMVYLRKRAA